MQCNFKHMLHVSIQKLFMSNKKDKVFLKFVSAVFITMTCKVLESRLLENHFREFNIVIALNLGIEAT
jgi:UDP-N-acetyl-D-mannosaminuronate dehydrogenase